MKNLKTALAALSFSILGMVTSAHAQITPSADAYTNTAAPTTNYGAKTLLDVDGASQITYIQFNLSSVPASASISQATLKLYLNSVVAAGSFNVDYVNGAWTESKIDANNAPPLGAAIASNISITTSEKNQYILVDITSAVQAWQSGSATNNGIALVANASFNATFDSKENTTTSHPPELDIAFAGGDGTITGVTTASGSGLQGGGTGGTLNLSLSTSCGSGQGLVWNGSAWACQTLKGSGTVTSVGFSAPSSDFTVTGSPVTSSGTLGLNWTVAPTNNNTANAIVKRDSTGNFSAGTVTAAGLNVTDATLTDVLSITSSASNPLYVTTPNSTATTAIYGSASSTTGTAFGVEGVTASNSSSAYGFVGNAVATSGNATGVYGITGSANGVGVLAQLTGPSTTGAGFAGLGSAVWADSAAPGVFLFASRTALLGTADDANAAYFENNSPSGYATLQTTSNTSEAYPFVAFGASGICSIDSGGNLRCEGTKTAVVPVDGGKRKVALSAIESPQNWFEDFGSAQLVNGAVVVELDSTFTQTVNAATDYKVFPVPTGDCKGLYVTNKTATSFEVHELGGGTSNVSFDYRIAVLRKNYETVRFDDQTRDMQNLERQRPPMRAAGAHPVSHDPGFK